MPRVELESQPLRASGSSVSMESLGEEGYLKPLKPKSQTLNRLSSLPKPGSNQILKPVIFLLWWKDTYCSCLDTEAGNCRHPLGFSFFRPRNIFFSATCHSQPDFFCWGQKKTFVFFLTAICGLVKDCFVCNLPCFGILFLLLLVLPCFFFVCLVCVPLRTTRGCTL